MTVRAYEIVKADAFSPSIMTLRFPRCKGIRDAADKPWSMCEKYDDVLRRFRDGRAKVAAGKRTAADVAAEDQANPNAQAKKPKKAPARAVGVLAHLRLDHAAYALAAKESKSSILAGHVAVVKGFGDADPSSRRHPSQLRLLVARLGGTVDANPTSLTTLLIDADDVPGAQIRAEVERAEATKAATYDIVSGQWLLDCESADAKVPLEPRYVRYACPETAERMAQLMDVYGDRYFEEATSDSFRTAVKLVGQARAKADAASAAAAKGRAGGGGGGAASSTALVAVEGMGPATARCDDDLLAQIEMLPDADARALTRGPARALLGVVAYSPHIATRLRLRLAGATTCDTPDVRVTHAVLPPDAAGDGTAAAVRAALSSARVASVTSGGGGGGHAAWLVSESWLEACEDATARIDEEGYAIREGRAS